LGGLANYLAGSGSDQNQSFLAAGSKIMEINPIIKTIKIFFKRSCLTLKKTFFSAGNIF
jgi:hypothetical protein